jgi:hypothetical protein
MKSAHSLLAGLAVMLLLPPLLALICIAGSDVLGIRPELGFAYALTILAPVLGALGLALLDTHIAAKIAIAVFYLPLAASLTFLFVLLVECGLLKNLC